MENINNNMDNTFEDITVNTAENNVENPNKDSAVNTVENNTVNLIEDTVNAVESNMENTIENAEKSGKNNVIELKLGISNTGGKEEANQVSLFDETAIQAAPNGQFGFNLFGDEPNEKKEEVCKGKAPTPSSQQKSQKNTTSKATNPAPKPALEKIKVNEEWTVCFAAQRFQIHEFFDGQIPEGGVSLEELREKMELEFYELSKERVVWEHDKERKLLFPIVKGTSKG
jgi:hypothetical protein